MAQGIRTFMGYTNNYPVLTSLSEILKWNVDYKLGEINSLTFKVPAYDVSDGTVEIKLCFKAASAFTVSIDTSNFSQVYGINDIDIVANASYELSIVPMSNSTLTVSVITARQD